MATTSLVLSLVMLALTGVGVFNQNYGPAAVTFAFAGTFAVLYWMAQRTRRKVIGFEHWLLDNSEQLASGQVSYEGHLLDWHTPLHQYLLVVSVIVMTFRVPSRFYVAGLEPTRRIGIIHTVTSILIGPWGIPWGPIYTVQAIYRNARGGYRMTIGEWITAKRNGG